jgi:hypothetical protein
MTRKAILIESSNVKGLTDLPGARIDVLNWRNFLKSDLGGAWLDSEIVTLNKPLSSEVENALKVANDSYCFVAFSGHGCDGSVVLNDYNSSFAIASLRPKGDRATLVLDACRGVPDLVLFSSNLKVAMANEAIVKGAAMEALHGRSTEFPSVGDYILNRIARTANHRTRWENAITTSSRGLVQMLACAKGQASNENPSSGGFYTSLLMQSAERWNQHSTLPGTHSTKDAHDYAAAKLPAQQKPEYSPYSLAFPFAVRI